MVRKYLSIAVIGWLFFCHTAYAEPRNKLDSLGFYGYAYSEAQYLGDDGLMLGYYELFDSDSSLLGFRAFRFTVEDGFSDLGLLIDGGLELFDWEYLAVANDANDMGQILGRGALNNMIGNAVFLATPSAVPLSPAVWLFGYGLLGLIALARRKE